MSAIFFTMRITESQGHTCSHLGKKVNLHEELSLKTFTLLFPSAIGGFYGG